MLATGHDEQSSCYPFQKSGSGSCDKDDLPESKIEKYSIKQNRMDQYSYELAAIDPDPDYSNNFIKNNFEVSPYMGTP